jgi:hypothetical protein
MSGLCDNHNCNEPLADSCNDCGFSGCIICVKFGFHNSATSRLTLCRITNVSSIKSGSSDHEIILSNGSEPDVITPITATPTIDLAGIFRKTGTSKIRTASSKDRSIERDTSYDTDDAVTILKRIEEFVFKNYLFI